MLKRWGAMLLVCGLYASAIALLPQGQGQGQGQAKKDDKQKDKQKDSKDQSGKKDSSGTNADPFGGTIQATSSKKTADTATLGFKGVGPDGEIDEAKLKEDPTSDDRNLVTQIKQIAVANDDLKEFAKDGNLKSR